MDGSADNLAVLVSRHLSGSDFDHVPYFKDSLQNTASDNASFHVFYIITRLIDIKRSHNNKFGLVGELSLGHWNVFSDVLTKGVDVMVELGGNRDDGRVFGSGSLNEFLDFFVVFGSCVLITEDKVHLVLDDDDLVQLHNFHSG